MSYCPECGHEVAAQAADDAAKSDVEIARINADRDVTIARLQSKAVREENDTTEHVAETEAAADVGVAEAQADGVEAAAEVISGDPEPEPDGEPIVVEPLPEAEPEPDAPPPPEAEHHHAAEKKSPGWWDAYQ